METALYGEGGFFASGHGAGRAGRDFVTSPEVGSLFGVCVSRALDRMWHTLGAPDPFLVIEAGAGNGRLARDVLRGQPECRGALRYVLVERSPVLRAEQRERLSIEPADEALGPFLRRRGEGSPMPEPNAGPVVAALDDLPSVNVDGVVVLANELLDNLPFGVAEWDGARWQEVRIAFDGDRFGELLVPMEEGAPALSVPAGTRAPIPRGIVEWFRACDEIVRRGMIVVIDYMAEASELALRPWLRTYRGHERGGTPADAPGTQDITADLVFEQLVAAAPFALVSRRTQADWLRDLGIQQLVEEGRREWEDGAAHGGLAAVAGRSRVNEADALTDPAGLGAHRVAEFVRLD
jgi:NADH dehydrogenase [ubiquinone] 1 alpha subcomplex assembly factor 7